MPKQSRDDPVLKKAVGRRLRAYRDIHDVEAQDLCADYTFGPTAWSNWEKGIRLANVVDMIDFASDSGLTLDFIYRGRLDGLPFDLALKFREALKLGDPRSADVRPFEKPPAPKKKRPPAADASGTDEEPPEKPKRPRKK